ALGEDGIEGFGGDALLEHAVDDDGEGGGGDVDGGCAGAEFGGVELRGDGETEHRCHNNSQHPVLAFRHDPRIRVAWAGVLACPCCSLAARARASEYRCPCPPVPF